LHSEACFKLNILYLTASRTCWRFFYARVLRWQVDPGISVQFRYQFQRQFERRAVRAIPSGVFPSLPVGPFPQGVGGRCSLTVG